ncbi:MAG: right-handed parallel beta-helix repeat-containing protein [Planctomycetes bacterium]|nr:right-handed parallel beta-helix repeat-containing protein [Planctomycetota bacterium]MCH9724985.1 right-handed parallel beta-helix repeat-containing protein [Planctomycetota bacterium]MCH9777554.1 right-handed parallel beta-helix repeat-containing protein [Planctomycetota bacterium]
MKLRTISTLCFAALLIFGLCLLIPDDSSRLLSQEQPTASGQQAGCKTVLDYGARGDGKTDDTNAIQKMVDASVGSLRFPRGRYRFTRPVVIDLNKVGPTSVSGDGTATILMEGAGPAFHFIGTHNGTASPKTVQPVVWEKERTPMVDGIEIVGKHPEAIGVSATKTMQITITRLVVRKALHGIHLYERNRNVAIDDCHLYQNEGVGIYLDKLNLHQVNISDSHISYNKLGGIVVRESEIRNIQIGNCDIEGNMGEETPATANILFDIRKGSLREGAIFGCTIQHTNHAIDSANVRFIGNGPEDPRKVGNFAIADNSMSDVAVNIHLKHARGITITGNTLWQAYEHNLLVEDSSYIVLGANLLDRNPDYRAKTKNANVFKDCSDCTLNSLNIKSTREVAAGLILENCERMNVTNCSIRECENGGILLKNVKQSRISDCLITEAATDFAIRVAGGQQNQVTDNLVSGSVEIESGTSATNNLSID